MSEKHQTVKQIIPFLFFVTANDRMIKSVCQGH